MVGGEEEKERVGVEDGRREEKEGRGREEGVEDGKRRGGGGKGTGGVEGER